FLRDRNRDRGRRKQEQDECFPEVAEDQVDEARCEEQREHRLAQGLDNNATEGATLPVWQRIRAFGLETSRSLYPGKSESSFTSHHRSHSSPWAQCLREVVLPHLLDFAMNNHRL